MSKAMQEKDSLPDVLLSTLLAGTVIDSDKKEVGGLVDAIVRLRSGDYPILSGLVVRVGASNVFLPISDVVAINGGKIEIRKPKVELQPFDRREGEVFLNAELLAHRFIDLLHLLLVRAFDAGLTQRSEGWLVTGLDTHKRRWFQRSSSHIRHEVRDWGAFEALIGHLPSLTLRSLFGRLRTLKAAQIADLIEMASPKEREDLLSHLHENPELEADVFEELKENDQSQLLKGRSTEKIASVLAHMRTDDAVDAILDLPQDLRQAVLDLLPEPKHADVLRLMKYSTATAGGLMGLEYLAVSQDSSIQDALAIIRLTTTHQPEALTTIYSLDESGALVGALSLVRALQLDPAALLSASTEPEPIFAHAWDDLIDIANKMADFNLLTLPILDENRKILGVITVDDALEVAIPEDWRQREIQK